MLSTESICPIGWFPFKQNCVKVSDASLKFDDAKATGCVDGAFLADPAIGFWIQVPR